MLNGIPVYKMYVDINDPEDGVSVMSIVKDAAVEKDFLLFGKQSQEMKFSFDDEKRIITGVALRCDYPIYRKDGDKEFYVTFDAPAIEKIVHKFMKEKHTDDVNIQHDKYTNGVYLYESFILSSHHTIDYPEFKDVSEGSWMVSYKVDNPKVWEKIKKGELRGFSVEITASIAEDKKEYKQLYNILKIIEQHECITKSKNTAR